MILILISIVFLLPTTMSAKNTLPVFVMDKDKTFAQKYKDPNPFDKIGTNTFEEMIHDAIKHSEAIIIFIEETFSVEDISLKDEKGSPYFYLRQSVQEGKTKYFPAVIHPYKTLTQIFEPQQFNIFHLKSQTKLELLDTIKYMYVFFEDKMNETRMSALRRHDSIIKEVCHAVQMFKNGPIVAFYTGKTNPVVEEKMHFVPIKPIPIPKDLGVMVVSSGALFRFSGVYAATPTRRAVFNQLPMIAAEKVSKRTMTTRMAYVDFELEFNFSFKDSGWLLDDVVLMEGGEEVGRTIMAIGAPWNMSYVCGEPLVIVNTRDGSVVTISQYQIQPRLKEFSADLISEQPDEKFLEDASAVLRQGMEGTISFGRSTNCGPYFNIAILSSLMVSFVCIAILMYGIVCMMNIRTNDKYEDPLGKQLIALDN